MDFWELEEGTSQFSPPTIPLPTPHCFNMEELPTASSARTQTSEILALLSTNKPLSQPQLEFSSTPLYTHLSLGLALTTGSALGRCKPPTPSQCLSAFQLPNKVGLTAGARAWTKHAHRSQEYHPSAVSKKDKGEPGWWGRAQGPRDFLNEGAYQLFCKIMQEASWKNLHALPHNILAYEMRVPEGYGMRWSQDRGPPKEKDRITAVEGEDQNIVPERPWIFRGFVEPMIENGHELGWRHDSRVPRVSAEEQGDLKPNLPPDVSGDS
ncbi:hypothetical protein D9756_007088 [Leucocoprinus leucothites]|uniref:Uncharacterized protein n=1 Tax=Leucocoprinus leucothites TaxID=201217 RepID=A0A8H5D7J2_9AGAR|nr:hypothetical protein D9756_007088 [Leucoagaricus leucothites]